MYPITKAAWISTVWGNKSFRPLEKIEGKPETKVHLESLLG